jgi:hypothetical protein
LHSISHPAFVANDSLLIFTNKPFITVIIS